MQKHEKYQIFLSENFSVLVIKFSIYLNVFVMSVLSGGIKNICCGYSLKLSHRVASNALIRSVFFPFKVDLISVGA